MCACVGNSEQNREIERKLSYETHRKTCESISVPPEAAIPQFVAVIGNFRCVFYRWYQLFSLDFRLILEIGLTVSLEPNCIDGLRKNQSDQPFTFSKQIMNSVAFIYLFSENHHELLNIFRGNFHHTILI